MTVLSKTEIILGEGPWGISDILCAAQGSAKIRLSTDSTWRKRIQSGSAFLQEKWQNSETVYGVTTGYGDSCPVSVPKDLVLELPRQLTRFHGCGLGRELSSEASIAVMAVRLASFAPGFSGVRLELLETLARFINCRISPIIPEEGSVGASGDLTPLSYVAAALMGEREVIFNKRRISALDALKETGIEPLVLEPKEGLAIMNGTAVMTALACFAYERAERLLRTSARITSLAAEALGSNKDHFDQCLFAAKPHPGQAEVASWIRHDLGEGVHTPRSYNGRLQDRYSIRCAPHVLGVLADAMPWFRSVIETEINSANDNPLIDGELRRVMHGGHFYGGHIAFVMDSMKNAVANIADLLDRQLALLMDTSTNNGLPANLSGASTQRAPINHGFKAVQIAASAWTAEALKATMPASVFSRSTECHNQDKVSMGTIAARDCLRVLELSEQVASAALLASVQGVSLRKRAGELSDELLTPELVKTCRDVSSLFDFLDEDRPLDQTLRDTGEKIRTGELQFYSHNRTLSA